MPVHSKCPLCGSESIRELYECEDFLVSGDKFPLFSCSSCSFVFTGNSPVEEEAAAYYSSEDYISHSDTEKGLLNKLYHRARSFMLSFKFRMLCRITGLESASVLDIGSGTGYFPLYLETKGWKSRGIEISKEARQFALKKNKLSLLPPEAINDFSRGSIDIITMWHTLEHFYHPDDYLEQAYRILEENGWLLIAVPNHLSYDAQKYRAFWAGWDVPRHLWHFNPHTIKLLAGKHHFKLHAMKSLPLDSFYVSVLSEKYKKSTLPLLKGFFAGLLSWINSLFNTGKSSSLVYFFRKEEVK